MGKKEHFDILASSGTGWENSHDLKDMQVSGPAVTAGLCHCHSTWKAQFQVETSDSKVIFSLYRSSQTLYVLATKPGF